MTAPTNVPLSKVRDHDGWVFLSGELPIGSDGAVPEGIEAQTSLTLDRIEATLKTQGLTLADVISVSAYLVNTADFPAFNRVYASRFPQPYPVRTTIRTDLMLPKALLELTVIARQPKAT